MIFGGKENTFSDFANAKILLQSIPYDGTTTWGKGADKGFSRFIEASENMELYDIETDLETFKAGIHVMPELEVKGSAEEVFKLVYQKTGDLLSTNKFLSFFGGEHSISIGIIKAFAERYNDLTVLQLDAHADLRKTYLGSKYNHACALHEASLNTNLIQVGIRSMDVGEKKYLNPDKCFFAGQMQKNENWMEESIGMMTDNVYLTLDLDVLDPSIMPSTGTPEPGGLQWFETIDFLRQVFQKKNVVGFDIVEFAPIDILKAPDFLVSKLYYKLLSYKIKSGL